MDLLNPDCDGVSPQAANVTNSGSWCGFCLRQYTEMETLRTSEHNQHHIHDGHERLSLFFKLLWRYVGSQSKEKNPSLVKSNDKNHQLVDVLGFGSCQDCSYLLEEFCHFYNEIKIFEMKMNMKLDMICTIIRSAEKVSSRVQILQEILLKENKSFNDLQFLRKEVINKVSAKLNAALPKVNIKRKRVLMKPGANHNVPPPKQLKQDLETEMENSEDTKLEISEPFALKRESVDVEQASSESRETESLDECLEGKIKTGTVLNNGIEDVPEPADFLQEFDEECQDLNSSKPDISPSPQKISCEKSNGCCNGPRQCKVNDKISNFSVLEDKAEELEKADPLNYLGSLPQPFGKILDQNEKINKSLSPEAENFQIESNDNNPNLENIFDESIEDEVVLEESLSVSAKDSLKITECNDVALGSTPSDFKFVMDESISENIGMDKKLRRSKRKSACKNKLKAKSTEDVEINGKFLKIKDEGCRCPKCREFMKSNLPPLHTGKGSHWFGDIPLRPEARQLFIGPMRMCKAKKCKKEFFTDSELDVHKKLHAEFKCNSCEMIFDYAPKLLHHEMTHVSVNDQQIQSTKSDSKELLPCPRCPYSTKTMNILCTHFIETHLAMPLDYCRCLICGNQFHHRVRRYFRKAFRDHLRTAHDYSKKFYRCKENECVAYFNLKLQLLLHENDHFTRKAENPNGKKTIECTKCGKKFSRKGNAIGHYRRLHRKEVNSPVVDDDADNEDESCVCHHCGKTFKNRRGLTSHIRNRHNDNPKVRAKPKKTYICETCGKDCKDTGRYTLHMLAHSGPAYWRFECTNCGKRCLTQQKLDEHMRTHSNEKPFSCEYCGFRYAHRHNLRIHINNKHSEITATEVTRKTDKSSLVSRKNAPLESRKRTNPRKRRRPSSSDSDSISLSD